MLGKTHRIGGVSFAAVASAALYVEGYPLVTNNPEVIPLIIAGGWVGGLMPDIDHPNSTISNYRLLGIPIMKPFAWLIYILFGHRGATHTLWLLYASWLPIMFGSIALFDQHLIISVLITMFGFGYLLGYFSHLILDSFTPSGTPMLWPLPDIHLGQLTTGVYDLYVQMFLVSATWITIWAMFTYS